ncbi:MAG: hypothetical protein AAGG51_29830 [Cyanobacteria bacterium P01_G01_bin.54]
MAPSLLFYEVTNALHRYTLGGYITTEQADELGASHFGTSRLHRPHPPTPSPFLGEGEPDSKSLSQLGRGI